VNKLIQIIKILLGVAIIGIILFFGAMIFIPQFSYGLVFVKSGSMEPTIKIGSGMIIHKQDRYSEGDIVTFVNRKGNLITHRIIGTVESNSELFQTKGDNNDAVDIRPVNKQNIKGKVVMTLPYVGYLISFLKSKYGIVIVLILALFMYMFMYFVMDVVLKSKVIKKKQKS